MILVKLFLSVCRWLKLLGLIYNCMVIDLFGLWLYGIWMLVVIFFKLGVFLFSIFVVRIVLLK